MDVREIGIMIGPMLEKWFFGWFPKLDFQEFVLDISEDALGPKMRALTIPLSYQEHQKRNRIVFYHKVLHCYE